MLIYKHLSLLGLVVFTSSALTPANKVLGERSVLKRQAPGSPKFSCHSNCGSTIAGARIQGHCSNSTWTDLYEECLDCAVEQGIWDMYGRSVGAAGQACGLSTTPDDIDDSESFSDAPAPSSTPAPVFSAEPSAQTKPPTTTAADEAEPEETGTSGSPAASDSEPETTESGAPTATSSVTAGVDGVTGGIPVNMAGMAAMALFVVMFM
ncbi:hypothetical protein QBC37DRAFT_486188 [Rhypophila decipiens]|uniref:Uncharacterized protein n=1 Tax=Rhypophila decipiens TaxID=261697 RepID=A0AAN6Y4M3_9PEZI|nr:hypothetical protein QBC37DRAFT_486188 [Rhypophila decipiens]